jgi:hypothetical protein
MPAVSGGQAFDPAFSPDDVDAAACRALHDGAARAAGGHSWG